jgi:hypothetical protein
MLRKPATPTAAEQLRNMGANFTTTTRRGSTFCIGMLSWTHNVANRHALRISAHTA